MNRRKLLKTIGGATLGIGLAASTGEDVAVADNAEINNEAAVADDVLKSINKLERIYKKAEGEYTVTITGNENYLVFASSDGSYRMMQRQEKFINRFSPIEDIYTQSGNVYLMEVFERDKYFLFWFSDRSVMTLER